MTGRKRTLVICATAILLLLMWLLRPKPTSTITPSPGSTPTERGNRSGGVVTARSTQPGEESQPSPVARKEQNDSKQTGDFKRIVEKEAQLWRTPLRYYGKVIDEEGNPVVGARASYGGNALDETLTRETRNEGTVTTDERGIFKIEGLNGIGLTIQVSHPDYYASSTNSTGFDVRSVPLKGYFSETAETAEIFRLHRKGHPVPLVHYDGGFHCPNDGSVAKFPLRGANRTDVLSELQIQGWRNVRTATTPFDWKVHLTLSNGGIVEKADEFNFVAPESNYAESVEIEVDGSEMVRKEYFFKLAQGYIRFKFMAIMGKDLFVTGDYDFNPDGSRNLEPAN